MPRRSKPKYSPLPCSKASPAIKRLIVKPIPQAKAIATTWGQLTFFGSWANRRLTARPTKNKIPSGFPINNPDTTPIVTGCASSLSDISVSESPAWANAKIGRIANATGPCKSYSSSWSGGSPMLITHGNAKGDQNPGERRVDA